MQTVPPWLRPASDPEQGSVLTDLVVNILSLLDTPVNGVRRLGQNKIFVVSERLISEEVFFARAERIPDFIAPACRQNEYTDLDYVADYLGHSRLADCFTFTGAVF